MNLKKKAALLAAVFATLTTFIYSQSSSDTALFGELNSAYQSGAYPAVVEYASQMETKFPRSLLIGKSLCYKGESLYHLGRYNEAHSVLEKAVTLCDDIQYEYRIASLYWLGKTEVAEENYEDAFNCFEKVCVIYNQKVSSGVKADSKTDRYNYMSFLYGGRCSYWNENYVQSQSLFEYIISNGNHYTKSEYEDAMLMLFDCYKKNNEMERAVAVYKNIPEKNNGLSAEVYGKVTLAAGDFLCGLKKYKAGYDLYCKVLNGDDSIL